MAVKRIDQVTFGAADMAKAKRFLGDWDVRAVSQSSGRLHYQTRGGSDVLVCNADDPALPAGFQPGNTLRELIWSAENQAELDKTLASVRKLAIVMAGANAIARTVVALVIGR